MPLPEIGVKASPGPPSHDERPRFGPLCLTDMAVKSEPSNDDEFKMSKDKPEESSIIRKDILWIIWTFFNVFPSETYETIKLFILHMLMSILKGRLQGRNLLGGTRWIIYLFLLCGIAPLAASADILGCSHTSRSPNDSVLDFDEVKRALIDGSTLCNFSHQGYEHVCEDAFHGMTCQIIDLTGNGLRSLPPTVFQNVVNLREVFLDGNMFVEMPELINENNLMFLSINDNPLVKFSNQSTNSLPNLTILSVENCPNLLAIDEAAFENNLNLRVRFSGTPLQKLPCSNCFYVTLEGTDTVHLMCGSGSAIVTFESEIGENVFLNKAVEMFLQTNDSSSSICINQANSETHSTTHTSLTPTSVPPTSATPASVTPASATPTSAPPTSATPTSATPASATPASATTTSAILTLTTPASVTPTSATPTAVPKSATPRWTATLEYLIPIGVVVLVLIILVLAWLYRKDIQTWCRKRSGIFKEDFEMLPKMNLSSP